VVSLGIFSVVPPTEPCALRSTQALKVSTTDFSWGKGGRCIWLMTSHPRSAETSRKSRALIYPNPLGPLGLSRETFTFTLHYTNVLPFPGATFKPSKYTDSRKPKIIVTLSSLPPPPPSQQPELVSSYICGLCLRNMQYLPKAHIYSDKLHSSFIDHFGYL